LPGGELDVDTTDDLNRMHKMFGSH